MKTQHSMGAFAVWGAGSVVPFHGAPGWAENKTDRE